MSELLSFYTIAQPICQLAITIFALFSYVYNKNMLQHYVAFILNGA